MPNWSPPISQSPPAESCWHTEDRPRSVEVIIGWVRDAAARDAAAYIAGASYRLHAHSAWIASEELHPNEGGYAQFAVLMDAELQRLGLGCCTKLTV